MTVAAALILTNLVPTVAEAQPTPEAAVHLSYVALGNSTPESSLAAADEVDTLAGMRYEYSNVVGEIALGPNASVTDYEQELAELTIAYGTEPVVTALIVTDSDTRSTNTPTNIPVERSALPAAQIDPIRVPESGSKPLPRAAEDVWSPDWTAMYAYESNRGRHIDLEMAWGNNENSGHSPKKVAAGWGIEAEVVQTSDAKFVGSRPACVGLEDPETAFWAARKQDQSPLGWSMGLMHEVRH